MSGPWADLFGRYKSIQVYPSHIVLTSTSILPHMRLFRSGCDLQQQRMTSENDTDFTVTRTFTLPTEVEAEIWYGIWKENIRDKISY